MPRISNSIKSGDFNEFDDGVRDASGAVCALTESAAQVSTHLCIVLWYSCAVILDYHGLNFNPCFLQQLSLLLLEYLRVHFC